MEAHISLEPGSQAAALESLADWLRGEPELAGRVSVVGSKPGDGELGVLGDALVVAVGSGGTASVLAMSLKAWLSQPRRSDIQVRIEAGEGRVVEIDAHRVDTESVQALLRQAIGDDLRE